MKVAYDLSVASPVVFTGVGTDLFRVVEEVAEARLASPECWLRSSTFAYEKKALDNVKSRIGCNVELCVSTQAEITGLPETNLDREDWIVCISEAIEQGLWDLASGVELCKVSITPPAVSSIVRDCPWCLNKHTCITFLG